MNLMNITEALYFDCLICFLVTLFRVGFFIRSVPYGS